jgi:hypothetical protein
MSSKPRVIRKVTVMGRDGRPKIARDRKARVTIERVKAQKPRPCGYYACRHDPADRGWIATGTEYAKVTSPLHVKTFGHRSFPEPKDYHFECVPPEARPLVRFFKFPETTVNS